MCGCVGVHVSIGVCIRWLRTCILPNLQLAQGVINTHKQTNTHTHTHTHIHTHTHTGVDRRLLEKVVGQYTCAALSHGEMNGHESHGL